MLVLIARTVSIVLKMATNVAFVNCNDTCNNKDDINFIYQIHMYSITIILPTYCLLIGSESRKFSIYT